MLFRSIGAGYFANKISGIGYPLRMTYVLFPWVYFRAAEFMEGLFNKQRTAMAVTFCVAQTGISLLGALLDPGSVGITATGILDGILRRFSP